MHLFLDDGQNSKCVTFIFVIAKQKVYTFRPFGATMVKEGVAVTALQEKEGSLAISAVSNALTYGCVLPSHAFAPTR